MAITAKPPAGPPGLPHQVILADDATVDRLEFFAGTDLDAELRDLQAAQAERTAKAAARKGRGREGFAVSSAIRTTEAPTMSASAVEACVALFEGRPSCLESLHPGLPSYRWWTQNFLPTTMGWLELSNRPSVEVRFMDWDACARDGMPVGRKLCVGLVVLAAEELEYRCQRVPPELAAAASLALVTGAIHVTRKARLP